MAETLKSYLLRNLQNFKTDVLDVAFAKKTDVPKVDTELSATSTNTVQNKAISNALNAKMNNVTLADVATSGSYNDLTDKPVIPDGASVDSEISDTSVNPVQNKVIHEALAGKMDKVTLATVATTGAYSDLTGAPELADIATSGSYRDLTDKPVIPEGAVVDAYFDEDSTNPVQNKVVKAAIEAKMDKVTLANVATSGAYSDLSGTPELATVATTGAYGDLTGTPTLSTVATTNSYNDLDNKPSIPDAVTVDSELSDESENPVQNKIIKAAIDSKVSPSALAAVATSGLYSDIEGIPTLSTVATTGSYNDLEDVPTFARVASTGDYGDLNNKPYIPVDTMLRANLTAGETSIIFENEIITTSSVMSFYTSVYGISPTAVEVADGSVTLTFEAQTRTIEVGVKIDG